MNGNSTTTTRTVTVVDTTPPVITLSGASSLTILQNSSYTDAGASCTDNVDLSCTVSTTGSVNTTNTGVYILTYTATDIAGNIATPRTRTVTVTAPDLTPPVVTLIGSPSITISHGSTYTDSGASWTDNVDGSGNTLS